MKSFHAEAFEAGDLETLKKWLAHEDVFKNLYVLYHPMDMTRLQEWFAGEKTGGAHIMKYGDDEKTVAVGMVHFIHGKNRCGELSFIVDPGISGMGYGSKVLDHLLRYSFHILNLHKVFLHTAEYNKKVPSLALKRGFVLEGTFRKEIYYSGSYYDTYRYGILQEEFEMNLAGRT